MFDQWQMQFCSDETLLAEYEKTKVSLKGVTQIALHVPSAREGVVKLQAYLDDLKKAVEARGLKS